MEYTLLGQTGLTVSRLCMGTMTFGSEADRNESQAMFNCCIDMGINFFDCANKYGDGESEKLLGEFAGRSRKDLILTTKGTSRVGSGLNDVGASRKHLMLELERSLKRLQTEYIDIYFLHYFDQATSLESTLGFINDAIKQGKILYYGMSNWSAWQIMKAIHICRMHGFVCPDCIQPMYSLLKRQAEVEILPLAVDQKLGVISYSPVGAGILTGKYDSVQDDEPVRLKDKRYYNQRYQQQHYFETARGFAKLAEELNCDSAPLAIRWVMKHEAVTAPIIGARNLGQLKINLQALKIGMDRALYEKIANVSWRPAPAHDRLEEQIDSQNLLR